MRRMAALPSCQGAPSAGFRGRGILRLAALAGSLLLAACASGELPGSLSPDLAQADMLGSKKPAQDVLYVTDRTPSIASNGGLSYSSGRARFISFGSAELVPATAAGSSPGDLRVAAVDEIGQFPPTPYSAEDTPKGPRRATGAVSAHEQAVAALQGEVARRLAVTKRKELVIFIHGYHNSFDDAVTSTGDICKTLHNDFVCVALTWPAGGTGGVFMGYNMDRESGDFSVPDMKKAIRVLADTKGVERVNIIAHSRGTDVLANAIQQLGIETYVSKSSLWQRYKIANIVLFAPDIDLDVATSKMFGVISDPDLPFGSRPSPDGAFPSQGPVHLTVYSSPNDKALDLSAFLFGSKERLGQIMFKRLPDGKLETNGAISGLHADGRADFIVYLGTSGGIGHSYFLYDPLVRADLAALIRDRKAAGDPGRMLVEIKRPFWEIADPGQTTASAGAKRAVAERTGAVPVMEPQAPVQ